MSKGSLLTAMLPVFARSRYPLAVRLILHPTKVATPATAARVLPGVHVNTAPAAPVPVAMDTVMFAVLPAPEVIRLPTASRTSTSGWVGKAVLGVLPEGCVRKTRPAGGPKTMLNR